MDSAAVRWLNDVANRGETLRQLVVWLATDMEAVLLLTLVLGWLVLVMFEFRVRRGLSWRFIEMGLAACIALGAGLAINQLIGHFWSRDRPYVSLSDVHLLLPPSTDPSFPSDHATGGLALTLVVLSFEPALGSIMAVETALLMLGRVAAGTHYPSDMLGGAFTALAGVAVAESLIMRLRLTLIRLAGRVPSPVTLLVGPPILRDRGFIVRALGVIAALLGLPALVENLADPLRLHPEWLELAAQSVLASLLAALCYLLIRGPVRRQAYSAG